MNLSSTSLATFYHRTGVSCLLKYYMEYVPVIRNSRTRNLFVWQLERTMSMVAIISVVSFTRTLRWPTGCLTVHIKIRLLLGKI